MIDPWSPRWLNLIRTLAASAAAAAATEQALVHMADPEARGRLRDWLEQEARRAARVRKDLHQAGVAVPEGLVGAAHDAARVLGELASWRSPDTALALAARLLNPPGPERPSLAAPRGNSGPLEAPPVAAAPAALLARWRSERRLDGYAAEAETCERCTRLEASTQAVLAHLGRPGAWALERDWAVTPATDGGLTAGCSYEVSPPGWPEAWRFSGQVIAHEPPHFWVERLHGPGLGWLEHQRRLLPDTAGATWLADRLTFVGAWGPVPEALRPSPGRMLLAALLASWHASLRARFSG